ncbi:MAG: GTP-binding protein [Nitrososphaerota archaeon]|nr:GTP-binding protein [Nitrososphaerota archaeon]
MPRFRQVTRIQELMGNKEAIRNVGIIAHIDHGKTTLADSLLAGAGLLSPSMAGTARVLDFLEEEQRRKITIKTANISLPYKTLKGEYLVNLIDTPGHVDFTGKVTRALWVIDGVIVVVDAVEGIMAQTEIVTRQALEERVCPVLFINKVDRLITELHFDAEQIQEKLGQLIDGFNDIVEFYGEAPYKAQWKVNPQKGTVAFGAALHGWGFTIDIAKQEKIKFQDILNAYQYQNVEKLKKTIPVHRAIFEMIINALPNPCKAQAYRIKKLQDPNANSIVVDQALAKCEAEGPAVMYVTNVVTTFEGGCVVAGRVFSGKICAGDKLHLMDAAVNVEVSKICLDMGFFQEEIAEVSAGNLATIYLPLKVKVGETLVDIAQRENVTPFEAMRYVFEPVMTVAIEPKDPRQLSKLLLALEKMTSEDPNLQLIIHKETGEYLLRGMGELHLELAANQLKRDFSLEAEVSLPRTVYMESITQKGITVSVKNSGNQDSFSIQVEPQPVNQIEPSKERDNIEYSDVNGNVLKIFSATPQDISDPVLELLISGFEYACRAGPLCGEPIRHLIVKLSDFNLLNFRQEDLQGEVKREICRAIFASFLTANPVLLEPIYAVTVSVSCEFAGESSRILTTCRGKVKNYRQNGLLANIEGFIPVAETFDFSKDLRCATSGRAVWQYVFDHWEKLSEKLVTQTVLELRKRRGLAEEVPKPEKFIG